MPDAELEAGAAMEAAVVLMQTRRVNRLLGTGYTPDEVAEMDPVFLELVTAVSVGLR